MDIDKKRRDAVDRFSTRYMQLINKIEKACLPKSECETILREWADDTKTLTNYIHMYLDKSKLSTEELRIELEEQFERIMDIKTRLVVAASISYSKWLDKHPPLANILVSKLRVPDLKIGVHLPKIE